MKNIILILSVFSLILISCTKSDEDTFTISVSPSEPLIRNSGDIIPYNIQINSPNGLSKFTITETIDYGASMIVSEKEITGNSYTEVYSYTVPDILENSSNITIKFSVQTSTGDVKNRAKIITAFGVDSLLSEYAGNTIYSCKTNQFNAYNLLTGAPMFSSDSTSHIADFCDSTNQFLMAWYSPSGIEFVRYNSFDYSNATKSMIEDAYNVGVKVEILYNISPNDIILTKIGNRFCAIKLIYVIDELGSNNDRYEFSIKR